MLTVQEQQQLASEAQRYDRLSCEEKIVCVADALTSHTVLTTIEEKYRHIRRRYGALPHHDEDETWVQGLAADLAELIGRTPYEALKDRNHELL